MDEDTTRNFLSLHLSGVKDESFLQSVTPSQLIHFLCSSTLYSVLRIYRIPFVTQDTLKSLILKVTFKKRSKKNLSVPHPDMTLTKFLLYHIHLTCLFLVILPSPLSYSIVVPRSYVPPTYLRLIYRNLNPCPIYLFQSFLLVSYRTS